MRDFLIVFPFVYLIDVWPIWAAAVLFNLWFHSDHDHPLRDYLFQTLGAVALGALIRLFKGRRIVLWQSIARGRLLTNSLIAVAAGFLATFAHGEVIELSGSPSPDQLFYLGRLITTIAVCIVLVLAYCVSQIIYQSADTTRNLAPGPLGDESRRRHEDYHGSHHHADDALYLELAVLQALVSILDLFAHQAAHFTWIMLGMFAAALAVFSTCNIAWSKTVTSQPRTVDPRKDS